MSKDKPGKEQEQKDFPGSGEMTGGRVRGASTNNQAEQSAEAAVVEMTEIGDYFRCPSYSCTAVVLFSADLSLLTMMRC